MEEVRSSILLSSTNIDVFGNALRFTGCGTRRRSWPVRAISASLARSSDFTNGDTRLRFVFTITMADPRPDAFSRRCTSFLGDSVRSGSHAHAGHAGNRSRPVSIKSQRAPTVRRWSRSPTDSSMPGRSGDQFERWRTRLRCVRDPTMPTRHGRRALRVLGARMREPPSADRVCVAVTTTVRPATSTRPPSADSWPPRAVFTRGVPRQVRLLCRPRCHRRIDLRADPRVSRRRQVRRYPGARAHYDDEITFTVRSLVDLVQVIIPFMDEHLPASRKRIQLPRVTRGAPDL